MPFDAFPGGARHPEELAACCVCARGRTSKRRLSFANGGPNQIPGLIVMRLSDRVAPDLDPNADEIIVFFNANDQSETLTFADTRGRHFKLTKVQRTSDDEIVTESRLSTGNGDVLGPRN